LKRRSRRGQPVMENHVDAILAKLQAERRWRRWVNPVFPEYLVCWRGGVDSRVYVRWRRKVLCCVCVLCGFDLELRKIL
jgi:hypothetical protein